jgi:putative membrane protein
MMDGGGGGWWWMGGGSLLFLVVVVLLVWLLVRQHEGPAPSIGTPPQRRGAEEILAERFARGEIDEKEYRSRLDELRR